MGFLFLVIDFLNHNFFFEPQKAQRNTKEKRVRTFVFLLEVPSYLLWFNQFIKMFDKNDE